MARGDEDGPGVPAITWGTLGLLLMSGITFFSLFAQELFLGRRPNGVHVPLDQRVTICVILLEVGGPHVIWALVAWRGRTRVCQGICAAAAVICAVFSVMNWLDPIKFLPREIALSINLAVGVPAMFVYVAGWLTGLAMLIRRIRLLFRRRRDPSADLPGSAAPPCSPPLPSAMSGGTADER